MTEAMQASKLTPADLARMLDVNRSTVTRWLQGKRGWERSKISQLAAVLDIDLSTIPTKESQEDAVIERLRTRVVTLEKQLAESRLQTARLQASVLKCDSRKARIVDALRKCLDEMVD